MKFCLKITLCMLGLISILFGVGGSLLINLSFHTSLEREQETAYDAYRMAIGTLQIVSNVSGKWNDLDISRTMKQLTGQNTNNWTALRLYSTTRVIYEYNISRLRYSAKPPLPGHCTIQYEISDQGGYHLILSGAMEAGGEILYLDMVRDISSLFAMRRTQQQTYQWVFLLMTGLCTLFSYSISHVLTVPLVSLSKASRSIAAGHLQSRARIYSNDEIGLVAYDFNIMTETLENNIFQLKEAAERQERFIGSFAHEAKTPMTSIIGYADLIRGQTLSMQEQIQAANYIVSEGKRLENLSQKLLDLLVLKNGKIHFSPVCPADLIQGLATHLEPIYCKQGISFCCDCEEGVCLLEPDLLKSLLVNLWDNARKSMNGKKGSILTHSEMISEGCRITIRDEGCGIPSDALDHLTEAFYRADKSRAREQGGVGLGLSLCREIAALHNGSILFESEVGKGTTVIVELKGGTV